MSIARVDAQGNYSGADASGNLNATITTSGSNPFLVVFAAIDSAGDISPTATHNSVSMGAGTEDNTTGQYQVVFTRKNPDIGTNLAVVVSTGLAGFSGGLIPVSYSGVDQTTPIGTINAQGTAAATSLASGTITCAPGNWIVGGLSLNTNLAGLAAGTAHGNSLVSSFNDGSEGIAYAEDLDGADDTINYSWTASDRASLLAFAINAAATAAAADGRDLSIPVRPTGPARRRAFQQVYADTPVTPVELTQSPAAPLRPGGMGPRLRRALPQLYPDSPITPTELTQTPAAPFAAIGPRRRRSMPQQYADTPATPTELTQSPAAPFRPGRGPGMGPMSLHRNLVWPSADGTAASPDVTVALSGVQGTGALGTLGVQLDLALTGNEATGAVGTLTPGTTLALTGLAATGSVGTLAPSTTVALTGVVGTGSVGTLTPGTALGITGVAGTGSVGTLAPSTTVTLTGDEATVTIGTLFPSGDVTVALTGVSATASIGDLTASGADGPVVAVQPVSVGGGGVYSRPIQDKYWREIERRYKKKKKQAEKKSKIAVEIVEDIARRGADLEDALQELKAELAEEHIRQSKVYVELLKLKLDLAEADEEEEEAVTLLASEEFRL